MQERTQERRTAPLHKSAREQNCDTQSGQEKYPSLQVVKDAAPEHVSMVIITTTGNLLLSNGSAPPATVALTLDEKRLIAAAPELFELVKLFEKVVLFEIKQHDRENDEEGARLKTVTLNLIRAAIAKATGAAS